MDRLWDDFLGYVEVYIKGKEKTIEQYHSDEKYFILWEKGISLIKEGVSPDAMDVFLEFEMQKLILNQKVSEKELLELIVMKKLIFKLYSGDYLGIAELSQHFLPDDLMKKYAVLLERLYWDNDSQTSEETSSQITLRICKNEKEK